MQNYEFIHQYFLFYLLNNFYFRDQEINNAIQEVYESVIPQPHLILSLAEDLQNSKFLPFMNVF